MTSCTLKCEAHLNYVYTRKCLLQIFSWESAQHELCLEIKLNKELTKAVYTRVGTIVDQ